MVSELPRDWIYLTVSGISENIVDCLHDKKPERKDTGLPFLQVFNIGENGRIDIADLWLISQKDFDHWRKRIAPRRFDILITKTGRVGEIAQILNDNDNSYGRNIVLIRPKVSVIDPIYLRFYMQSPFFKKEVNKHTTDGTILKSLHVKYIEKLRVILPPLPEQRAIAHILGSLDDKIELNRRMNTALEAMARTIFKSWFVDFDPVRAKAENRDPGLPNEIAALFPDSFQDSDLGEIPKGWRPSIICSEFNLTMGQSPPGKIYNETGDGLPFFQGRRDFGFRFPTNRVYCTAPKRLAAHGDTLVSVRAPVGDINMTMARCCVGRGVAGIRHKSGSRSYTYYAMHTLSDTFARFEAEGTVFGAINKKQFEGLRWLSPPGDLVNEFEKIAFPLDERIEKNTNEIVTLASLRDTLLPKLISGELRVPDAEMFIKEAGV